MTLRSPTIRALLVAALAMTLLGACNKRPADQPPTPTTAAPPADSTAPAPSATTPPADNTTPPPPAKQQ